MSDIVNQTEFTAYFYNAPGDECVSVKYSMGGRKRINAEVILTEAWRQLELQHGDLPWVPYLEYFDRWDIP